MLKKAPFQLHSANRWLAPTPTLVSPWFFLGVSTPCCEALFAPVIVGTKIANQTMASQSSSGIVCQNRAPILYPFSVLHICSWLCYMRELRNLRQYELSAFVSLQITELPSRILAQEKGRFGEIYIAIGTLYATLLQGAFFNATSLRQIGWLYRPTCS